jgi:peroxiredoxin
VQVQNDYRDRGLVVIGVTAADTAGARRFAEETGATYPILTSARADLAAWGVSSVPQSYLIDPSGEVVSDGLGAIDVVLGRELGR